MSANKMMYKLTSGLCSSAVLAAGLIVGSAPVALSEEDVPFPNLDYQTYCSSLVSKMLNPSEKRVELEKCLKDEAFLRDITMPQWHMLPSKTRAFIVNTYFKDAKYQTYGTVLKYEVSAFGIACVVGKQPPCDK